jgi:hypothetical protein
MPEPFELLLIFAAVASVALGCGILIAQAAGHVLDRFSKGRDER